MAAFRRGLGLWQTAAFAGMRKVGVTAGASTPDYDVEAVVERLRAMG